MKNYFLLIAFVLLLGSCTKTEHISNSPELEIFVTDANDNAIAEASISLYNNRDDWDERTNKIDSLLTDQNGYAIFKELNELQYFVFVEKDTLSNSYGVIGVKDSLQNDEIRSLHIQIQYIQ
ncbi:hypothetical protein BZG02_18970 [Labilibaculum filiforme]|uniref:Prealbumin-like fold domain-containing protein n=1 Tax=Labilibaculum filiforme TaxID=1940526 RepID=A0A2N3HR61_9BACT|nr:carboxypeptidase regulatory-like domain-containing protein [Labilibaculum filiforme]PKQ60548.1 hypothetical protein BZG02_18970 [Labilibaculum filiforme]